ncbi:hypothetical protein BH23CHL2_BH23CHL2_24290 [soil metagenome]
MEISDRGLFYPVLGIATASIVIALYYAFSGNYPDLISIAHLYLVGLGAGLIVARIGRLGPFQGILGSPWHESRIQEILEREAARALHYGRDLTVVAVRPVEKSRFELKRGIRATDQHLACCNGWNLLILPETDRASALFLLRQICGDRPVQVALASPDAERPRHRIEADLLEQIQMGRQPESITLRERTSPGTQPLTS